MMERSVMLILWIEKLGALSQTSVYEVCTFADNLILLLQY